MSTIACKFGGSSLADAERFRNVRDIILADPQRRFIVVSAPGKRNSSDQKITDLLYLCHDLARQKVEMEQAFGLIRTRFLELERYLNLEPAMEADLEGLRSRLQSGEGKDWVASRGEWLCARLMARYLEATFIDAGEGILLDRSGRIRSETYERLGSLLKSASGRVVVPGFYGTDPDGKVKCFSRGGSDITGAIVARAAGVTVYENWTDVSGLMMADPRIVENPTPLDEMTFRELRELSYMGASVFHDEAVAPVREVGIPIRIKNTGAPTHPGTTIVRDIPEITLYDIAGIAGKRGFVMFIMEKYLMNRELGFARRVLGIFESHNVNIEHCPSSIDSFCVIASAEEVADKEELLCEEIKRVAQPDRLEIEHNLALLAVVGEGFARQPGISGRVFTSLGNAGVNVRIIDQGASELNILIGVSDKDYVKSIQAIYAEMVKPNPKHPKAKVTTT